MLICESVDLCWRVHTLILVLMHGMGLEKLKVVSMRYGVFEEQRHRTVGTAEPAPRPRVRAAWQSLWVWLPPEVSRLLPRCRGAGSPGLGAAAAPAAAAGTVPSLLRPRKPAALPWARPGDGLAPSAAAGGDGGAVSPLHPAAPW